MRDTITFGTEYLESQIGVWDEQEESVIPAQFMKTIVGLEDTP